MTPRLQQTALCLAALALSGCQSVSSSTGPAQVRVVVASSNAPGIDVYAGKAPIAYNLGFGNVTTYIPLSPGATALSANTTGTRQTLTASTASLDPTAQYTILLGDTSANLQQGVLRDQNTPAPNGLVALRFLDQATAQGAVDIYLVPPGALLASAPALLTGQTFGANSGYLNLPAGLYRVVLCAAGAAPGIPLHTGPLVEYTPGSARTLILLDRKTPSSSALQMVTAMDYDPQM